MSDVLAAGLSQAVSNTLGLPCSARAVFPVVVADDVRPAMDWSQQSGLPLTPLGEGSNVVLPPVLEAGVLRVTDTSTTVIKELGDAVTLRVGAGKAWHALVKETVYQGLYGLENLALIPGFVGAAPVQNIGAYGREFEEFVVAVHGVNLQTGAAEVLSAEDCAFSYRESVFKRDLRDRFLITAVDLTLARTPAVRADYPALRSRLGTSTITPQAVFETVVAVRMERLPDPGETPNAGSFFKNPVLSEEQLRLLQAAESDVPVYPFADGQSKVSAAWLIERAGLRGYRHGAASMSETHALVLVTDGAALQRDVLELARHVQNTVQHRFAVMLEPEPRIYG